MSVDQAAGRLSASKKDRYSPGGEPARVSKLDDVAYMTALQAELRRSTRNELVSLFQEAIKRRAAGETLASIAKSYGVSHQTIGRL